MASTTSETDDGWPGRRATHADLADAIARRRAELGEVAAPRNSGERRTVSKRALLKAIEELGAKW